MIRRFLAWLVRVGALDQLLAGNPFERQTYEQLPDPFRAEVLLDGIVVGILTDRRVEDMFWASYRLEPRDLRVLDDELWANCRFRFRDPSTGRVCTTAFVGGTRPFVQADRVLIRAMYFAVQRRSSRFRR